MISKKYRGDYREDMYTDQKGRVRERVTYIGPYFTHTEEGKAFSAVRFGCVPVVALLWVLYGIAFLRDGYVARQVYVSVLFIITALPLIYLTWPAVQLLFSRVPYDRETSDDLRRFGSASKAMLALSGAACLSTMIALVLGRADLQAGDIAFAACSVLSFALSLLLFLVRSFFETRELLKGSEELKKLQQTKTGK